MTTAARKPIALGLAALAGFAASELARPRSDAGVEEALRGVEVRLEALAGRVAALRREGSACPVPPEVAWAEARPATAVTTATPAPPHLPAGPLDAAAPAPGADPAAEGAVQRGRTLVSDALVRGAWTEADALAFRTLLVATGREGREELLRLLAPAVNDGQIRVEAIGPPF